MNDELKEAIDLVDGIFRSTSFKNQKAINDAWDLIKMHVSIGRGLYEANNQLGETLLSLTKELGMDGATLPTNEQVKATMAEYKRSMEIRDVFIQAKDSQINKLISQLGNLEKDRKEQHDLMVTIEREYKIEKGRADELEDKYKAAKRRADYLDMEFLRAGNEL